MIRSGGLAGIACGSLEMRRHCRGVHRSGRISFPMRKPETASTLCRCNTLLAQTLTIRELWSGKVAWTLTQSPFLSSTLVGRRWQRRVQRTVRGRCGTLLVTVLVNSGAVTSKVRTVLFGCDGSRQHGFKIVQSTTTLGFRVTYFLM